MRAMLAAVAAGAFVAFGAASSAATAGDDPCPGRATASIVLPDGSTKVVCIELRAEGEQELLTKLVSVLDERSFQETFDPTDVASIQEVAKELGLDLDFSSASELSELLSGVRGGHKGVVDVLKDGLGGLSGPDLGGTTKEQLEGALDLGLDAVDTAPTGMAGRPDWKLYADGDDGAAGTDDPPDGPPSDPG
jgi:hypothetical protein